MQHSHSPNIFIPSFRLARTRQTLPLHSVPTIAFLESNVTRESVISWDKDSVYVKGETGATQTLPNININNRTCTGAFVKKQ